MSWHSQHDNWKKEIFQNGKKTLTCIVLVELPVERLFIRHQSWWKLQVIKKFALSEKKKMLAWKNNDFFSHKRAARRKPCLPWQWRTKASQTFPYWIAPMSIEKAWRAKLNYKTLLKLVGVKQKQQSNYHTVARKLQFVIHE